MMQHAHMCYAVVITMVALAHGRHRSRTLDRCAYGFATQRCNAQLRTATGVLLCGQFVHLRPSLRNRRGQDSGVAREETIAERWTQWHVKLLHDFETFLPFAGRPEKLPDVCYSWWVLASLGMLGKLHWIDAQSLKRFITAAQDVDDGGFADRPGDEVRHRSHVFLYRFHFTGGSISHCVRPRWPLIVEQCQ